MSALSLIDPITLYAAPMVAMMLLVATMVLPGRLGVLCWALALACCVAASWGLVLAGVFWKTLGFQMAAFWAGIGGLFAWACSRTPAPNRETGKVSQQSPAGNPQSGDGPGEAVCPPLPARRPKHGFGQVAGMNDLKARLMEAAREALVKGGMERRNGIVLYGPPGNGKTYILEALAHELKVPLLSLNYNQISSQWLGRTPRMVEGAFEQAFAKAPCILFMDECDGLLHDRGASGHGSGAQDNRRTLEALLKLMERARGSRVVVVAATNMMESLDAAIRREGRFDFKIEVTNPDEAARLALLQAGIAANLRNVRVDSELVTSLAKRWSGYSVKRILAVTEQAAVYVKRRGIKVMTRDDFMAALREVQGVAAHPPEGTKSLEELVLMPTQRKMLAGLARRLQNSFEFEQAGGSLPTGLLFYGPPGTGKTETARALAKASNYAFMATSGNDLIRDPDKMDKLWRDAMNARPAIVFVDEADDLLGCRDGSPYRSMTNKFLTLMDGAAGKVPDLLYIAATNLPENLDSAAVRGGRFTEKVEFQIPDEQALVPWLAVWFKGKGWTSHLAVDQVAMLLAGHSMANVQEALQQAINAALNRTGDFKARELSEDDIRHGLATIQG